MYESDPAVARAGLPRRYAKLSYADALARAAPLIQPKAVQLLNRFGSNAEIAAVGCHHTSVVGQHDAEFDDPNEYPTDVLLLGLGTVGFGVYQRLLALPQHFRVTGILVRDAAKHLARDVPTYLLHTRHQALTHLPADVVVDALTDEDLSLRLAQLYIAKGVPVITASKSLVADAGCMLTRLAAENAAAVRYSAAVGGSAPMLEAVDRAALEGEISSLCGVLNATCNFVLDRCRTGVSLAAAVGKRSYTGSPRPTRKRICRPEIRHASLRCWRVTRLVSSAWISKSNRCPRRPSAKISPPALRLRHCA